MTEWNCSCVIVEKVEKHPNADLLNIITVMGDYPVISNKATDIKVGDLVGYIAIDTVVSDTADFYFLCPRHTEKYEENGEIKTRQGAPKYELGLVPEKYRTIKAKKIRNFYSQGLLVPVPEGLKEGDSLVEILGLKKWEQPDDDESRLTDNLDNSNGFSGSVEKPPQGWSIPYYDIDGLRKYISCLQENEEIIITEKLHGAQFSSCYDGNRLWVKSRNQCKRLNEDKKCQWWDAAIRSNLEEKLAKYPMLVFFGELYGQVRGFRYDCEISNGAVLSKIRFFDIYDPIRFRYLDYDKFTKIINDAGLETCPELYKGVWKSKEEMYPLAEGPTTLGGKHVREGFVLKTIKERLDPKLGRVIIKLVGEGYNLAK